MLYLISERSFETMQQLAIAAYTHHKEKKPFCFESYFELAYKQVINYALEYLKIKDVENYRDLYYKHFKVIYDMSVNTGVYTSNRKMVFAYWQDHNKNFLKDVMDIYSNE